GLRSRALARPRLGPGRRRCPPGSMRPLRRMRAVHSPAARSAQCSRCSSLLHSSQFSPSIEARPAARRIRCRSLLLSRTSWTYSALTELTDCRNFDRFANGALLQMSLVRVEPDRLGFVTPESRPAKLTVASSRWKYMWYRMSLPL